MEKLEKSTKIGKINSFSRKGYDKKGMKSIVAKNFKIKLSLLKTSQYLYLPLS